MATNDNRTLKPGCRAYWDTFAGLVPCRVDAIESTGPLGLTDRPSSDHSVSFTVTDDWGPYKKGEKHVQWALHVIPPGALIRGQYSTRIGGYRVQVGGSQ